MIGRPDDDCVMCKRCTCSFRNDMDNDCKSGEVCNQCERVFSPPNSLYVVMRERCTCSFRDNLDEDCKSGEVCNQCERAISPPNPLDIVMCKRCASKHLPRSEIANRGLYKKMCWYAEKPSNEIGTCAWGSECYFAHSREELDPRLRCSDVSNVSESRDTDLAIACLSDLTIARTLQLREYESMLHSSEFGPGAQHNVSVSDVAVSVVVSTSQNKCNVIPQTQGDSDPPSHELERQEQ